TGKPLVAGKVVESMVLTKDLQQALGIDIGKEAWLIGMKVENPYVLKMIESGQLAGFSIGGVGKRVGVEKMSTLFAKAYNPDETRDDHGRWTSGGDTRRGYAAPTDAAE